MCLSHPPSFASLFLCYRADFDGYLLEDVGGGYLESSGGWATCAKPHHTKDGVEGVREGGGASEDGGVEEMKGEGRSSGQAKAQEGEQATEAAADADLGKRNELSFDEAQWKRWNRTSWVSKKPRPTPNATPRSNFSPRLRPRPHLADAPTHRRTPPTHNSPSSFPYRIVGMLWEYLETMEQEERAGVLELCRPDLRALELMF